MDPITIGMFIAAMASNKAVEKASGAALETAGKKTVETGWGLGANALRRLRGWFTDSGKPDGLTALDTVEHAAGQATPQDLARLAEIVDQDLSEQSPVRTDIERLLEQARSHQELDGVFATAAQITVNQQTTNTTVNQQATGDGNTVVGIVHGDANFGKP